MPGKTPKVLHALFQLLLTRRLSRTFYHRIHFKMRKLEVRRLCNSPKATMGEWQSGRLSAADPPSLPPTSLDFCPTTANQQELSRSLKRNMLFWPFFLREENTIFSLISLSMPGQALATHGASTVGLFGDPSPPRNELSGQT